MEKFKKDSWANTIRYARIDQIKARLVRFSADNWGPNCSCYGHVSEEYLDKDADLQEVYHDAQVLVRLPVGGPMEVLRCPPELLEEVRSVETWIGTHESFRYIETKPESLKAAPKVTPAPVELWWQKEQREAKSARAAIVALRNEIRKILGM